MALAGQTCAHKTSQNLKALDAQSGLKKAAEGSQGRGYSFARRKRVTTVTCPKMILNPLNLKDKNVTIEGSQRVTKKVTFFKSLISLNNIFEFVTFKKVTMLPFMTLGICLIYLLSYCI